MSRFRYSGYVDGSTHWKVSRPIYALGKQIEAIFPARHPADGTIASGSHAKWPRSDHGQDPNGIVRAIDAGVYLDQGGPLFEALRLSRDVRIKYCIHNRQIFSSYDHANGPPYTLRPYSGDNPHESHIHMSVLPAFDAVIAPWDLGNLTPTPTQEDEALLPLVYGHGYTQPENLTNPPSTLIGDQSRRREDVRLIQYLAGSDPDGYYGKGTAEAVADKLGTPAPVYEVGYLEYARLLVDDHQHSLVTSTKTGPVIT